MTTSPTPEQIEAVAKMAAWAAGHNWKTISETRRQRWIADAPEIIAALESSRPMPANVEELKAKYIDGVGECTHPPELAEEAYRLGQASGLGSPDDLRALGWCVAVHNDYRLAGEPKTFWLMVKDEVAIKGEGSTDAEALNQIRDRLGQKDAGR